ncbi:MAG TPA: alpha/beta hydrolase [Algoriphagus sp.]|jgi:pimeloyl-ACP methyl ester carboxylesterase|uniref:alpha/beta fold hydrolase n=2 Tax=Algoriphagus TaxID=246875 RepID=UPI000C420046|nr:MULTISPECIES: alpha/beta fold hydrolase [unclassified Algoriphagus]MAL12288.1 alpha/beta hydrolase [Algoriphagus sp.]HAH38812.1 alpha/beta hydrolase [Algoriphagus sp.]HAS58300.1 alpha/beta hydrolase [Algoriphagus sp.]HCB47080.1 alpha/beta hydrolase [Algoriphagus sp.]HCD87964.1 alpha/beta hydrolase [Algoriphagus sp.]|tara:strand:- start:30 stop:788 length:759 start_codon:yes stop_codon:yes gene_type:complete
MKLNFKKTGTGKPLVILHGLFGSADNWFSIAKELEKDFTLYLVDQRNHGDSPHSEEWNYGVMVEDLKELIDEEGLDRIYLMGHSMGGKTAMNFAVEYPERVDRLIVADIAPRYYEVHHQTILEGLNSIKLDQIKSRKEADDQLAKYIDEVGIRQFLLKSLGRNSEGFVWKINLPVITENIEEVGEELDSDGKYEGPTLFLGGSNSNYIRQEDLPDILEHFPNYQIEFVQDAGHWLHAEKPEAVIQEVRRFLN